MSLRCAVIGVGYLGKFHAQKYAALTNATLVAVVDPDLDTAIKIAAELQCEARADYSDLLDSLDAVSIVAPTTLHHKIAKDCLRKGIHVLVEKPITTTVAEADDLIQLAADNHCVLQVGHLERFNAAILALGNKLERQPLFIESHRLAPYKPRATDVDVVLDLMIHDIDIIINFVKAEISDIRASGASILSPSIDIANARLEFVNGCVANVTSSRISQKSERKMRIFQKEAYLNIDFQEKAAHIYRLGSDELYPGVPNVDHQQLEGHNNDALEAEIKDFLSAIEEQRAPKVSGIDGRAALAAAIEIKNQVPNPHHLHQPQT